MQLGNSWWVAVSMGNSQENRKSAHFSLFSFLLMYLARLTLLSWFIHCKLIMHLNLSYCMCRNFKWWQVSFDDIIDYYPCCNKYHNWSDKLERTTKLWHCSIDSVLLPSSAFPLTFPPFSLLSVGSRRSWHPPSIVHPFGKQCHQLVHPIHLKLKHRNDCLPLSLI